MNATQSKAILSQLDFLEDTMKNLDGFSSKLVGMGVITIGEQDGLKGLESKIKCRNLFTLLSTKSTDIWQKIIRGLEESTNDDAAEQLLKTESNLKKAGG